MGKRIIIFTNEKNAGVATALKERILDITSDSAVFIMDEMELRSSAVGDFAEKVFHVKMNFARNRAQIAERYYARFIDNAPTPNDEFKPGATSYRAMYKIVQKFEPDLILTIGYGAINEAVATRKYISARYKIVCVVADYTLHKCLVNPYVDGYVVCDEKVKNTLVAYGIGAEKITISDIPVEKKFLNVERAPISDRVSLGDKPTLLYIPTEDADRADEKIEELSKLDGVNVLLYAGTDRALFTAGIKKNIYTFNEGTSLPLLVANADIVLIPPDAYLAEICMRLGKTVFLSETSSLVAKRNSVTLREYFVDCEAQGNLTQAVKNYLDNTSGSTQIKAFSGPDMAYSALRLARLI